MEVKQKIKLVGESECFTKVKRSDFLDYQNKILSNVPFFQIPKKPYKIHYEIGISKTREILSILIPLEKILMAKYQFKGGDILFSSCEKKIVSKGDEYFKFSIQHINETK